jgi:hypothetical protein
MPTKILIVLTSHDQLMIMPCRVVWARLISRHTSEMR